MKRKRNTSLPTLQQLEAELERETRRGWHKRKQRPGPSIPPPKQSGKRDTEHKGRKRRDGIPAKAAHSPPMVEQLEEELKRTAYKKRFRRMVCSTVSTLIVVAAVAVLISHLLLPILRIYGSSMTPTLIDGNIVAAVRNGSYERGNVIAFYYNNKILVKRVIGLPGEWVDIDEQGNVSIDGEPLDEPYLDEKALGECDIELPYQVPDGRYFVMGDHRSVSSDSRSSEVGCVPEEQIIGKLIFRLWPFREVGVIE